MALFDIVVYPDSILKAQTDPVCDINGKLIKIVKNMSNTMYAAKGIGLAGPQVGLSLSLAVIDTSLGEDTSHSMALINPRIIETHGSTVKEEGCLSFPKIYAPVKRYQSIVIEYINEKGQEIRFEAEDFIARLLQHEIDHLSGICFIDRISMIRRDLIKRKLKKNR